MPLSEPADLAHLARHGRVDRTSPFATWRLVGEDGFLRHVDRFVDENPRISTKSFFLDVDWTLDSRPPSACRYERVGFRGIEADLANELKVALLVAMAHPASGAASIATAKPIGRGMAMLGGWMTHVGARTISHLGAACGELFMQALFEFVDLVRSGAHDAESGDWDPHEQLATARRALGRGGPTFGLVETAALGLLHLWNMREEIERLTGARMRGAPFRESTAIEVASSWGGAGERTTRRLPEPVLASLLAGASRMMGAPARDVVALVGKFVVRYRECGDREVAAEFALGAAEFSVVEGETVPWWSEDRHPARMSWFRRLVRLIHLVRDASAVLVFLATGMRPQEFLGLMGGARSRRLLRPDEAVAPGRSREMPHCVTEALSKTGYTVLLLLNGHVFKRETLPRPVSWLLGGRQDGGADPTALEALCVLEALHAPFRAFAVDGADGMMIVDFVEGDGDLEVATSHCSSARLAASLRRSIPLMADFSGLPDEWHGVDLRRYKAQGESCIAIYQFRKTWAQIRYKLDPSLLPAISQELQHRSLDDTKSVYVTDDPDFLRELDRPRSMATNLAIRELLDGCVDAEATMTGKIDDVVAMLGPIVPSQERAELWRARMASEASGPARDRLRPLSGMENLASGASGAQRGDGARSPAAVPRDAASTLREFVRERRGWLGDLVAGRGDLARSARDRALVAARRLNEAGFAVGGLAEGLGETEG